MTRCRAAAASSKCRRRARRGRSAPTAARHQPAAWRHSRCRLSNPSCSPQGQLALRFDPSLAVGDPVVRIDPRYGRADFTVDRSTPGLLVVSFTSPDASLNTVPGSIVSIDVTVAAGATAGKVSPLEIDPALSWLIDAQGKAVDLLLEAGTLTIQ